ncbi:MAG: zinc-dependent metalloprotease [Planctomycetota bacterium]|nr:MAG: zinc-dependent metalloprotease [Planctomycetota bacterium]
MRSLIYYVLILGLSFCLAGCTSEMAEETAAGVEVEEVKGEAEEKKEEGAAKKEEAEKKEEEKDKEKAFADVVKDFEVIEGLFTLYRKDDEGKVYMEIRPEQFEKIFLCSMTREAGDGYYFDSGAMMRRFPFVFKRVGKKVLFIHKNVYYRADKGTAIARAVARGVSDSIMGWAKIEGAPHPERGSILVEPGGFFIQDIGMVEHAFREYIKETEYSFDKETSYFGALRSFPENTEVDVVLSFKSSKPKLHPTAADPRSFQHIYRYSLSSLPETDYKPRLGDDRVGHFLTMHQDYTSVLRDTAYTRYINRWDLEKSEPRFKLSPPKQPIVFWLENTIPVEYREAVKEGVLVWNRAYERIGFKDAIVVKQQADDAEWDPADVRYNTIRWIVRPGGSYAVGPSRTNPFTGQIYDADVRISADIVRAVFRGYEEFAEPVAAGETAAAKMGIGRDYSQGFCDYQRGSAAQAAFGWSLLSARGIVGDSNEVDMEKYLHDYLVHLLAHEVGHTLGLRHNFKASMVRSAEELGDSELMDKEGLTGSLMDYVPPNIAPEGQKQGPYFQTSLGPYDYWAIEYAHRVIDEEGGESEKAVLEEIASRVAEPELTYGTDEDAFWGARGIDPTCSRYDLGDDPIEYFRGRVSLAKELWSKMEEKFEKEGKRYHKLRRVFGHGMGQYYTAVMGVTKYIGGIYHRRDHVGDPNGRIPFEPVSVERQREALAFLQEEVFGQAAYDFAPELLNKLAPERFWDFTDSIWKTKRIDYPIHDVVLSMQKRPLNHLYDPILLSRMVDIELRYARDEEPFTMVEMFEGVRAAIWSELGSGENINSFRRGLQRAHLEKLTALVIKPGEGVPEDATTLARADLVSLRDGIDETLAGPSRDAYTRAHLDESRAKIDAVLKASIERHLRSVAGG